jgi:hypothetical protein
VRGIHYHQRGCSSVLCRRLWPSQVVILCVLFTMACEIDAEQLRISLVTRDALSVTLKLDYPVAMMNEAWDVFSYDADKGTYNGFSSGWDLAPALLLTGTFQVVWSDVGQNGRLPVAEVTNRFYAAGSVFADQDIDGLSDARELFLYQTDPGDPDTDQDQLPDFDEQINHGADPNNPDSDGDLVGDGTEVAQGRNPFANAISDTAGILNLVVHTPDAP